MSMTVERCSKGRKYVPKERGMLMGMNGCSWGYRDVHKDRWMLLLMARRVGF